MLQSQSVVIDNIYLNINRYDYESDEMFYFRVKYIIDNYNKIDLDKLIGLSKIEQQKKFNECDYDLSTRI